MDHPQSGSERDVKWHGVCPLVNLIHRKGAFWKRHVSYILNHFHFFCCGTLYIWNNTTLCIGHRAVTIYPVQEDSKPEAYTANHRAQARGPLNRRPLHLGAKDFVMCHTNLSQKSGWHSVLHTTLNFTINSLKIFRLLKKPHKVQIPQWFWFI